MDTERKVLGILNWVSAAMVAISMYLNFIVAPTEKTMGLSQRIFYWHVGSGWVGAAALLLAVVAGVGVLSTGSRGVT